MSARNSKPQVRLRSCDAAISEASGDQQARWLELADIALHNHRDTNHYERRDTALESKRRIIRMTRALMGRFSRAKAA